MNDQMNFSKLLLNTRKIGENMFDYTPTQVELLNKMREYCAIYIYPNLDKFDEGVVPEDVWKAWYDCGFGCFIAPKKFGGVDFDATTCVILYEEIGKADLGISTGFGSNNLSSYPILIAGNDVQKKHHFDNIHAGKYGAFCLTEAGAGSDAGSVATEAVKDGDYYILNGDKCYITSGGEAIDRKSELVIFASTDRSKGSKGLSAFVVPGDTPGLSVGKIADTMGIRGSQTVELVLKDVKIPVTNLIGEEGQGMIIAMQTLDSSRLMVAAAAVGVAQRALEIAVDYVKNRIDGNKPLASQQYASFKIADMASQVESARLLVRRGAYLKDQNQPYSTHSAITKLLTTDVAMTVARDAMDLMGSEGFTKNSPIEKVWRDARILSIYGGTNQIQKLVISGAFLKSK